MPGKKGRAVDCGAGAAAGPLCFAVPQLIQGSFLLALSTHLTCYPF
jgi:hypothetical protein